MSTPANNFLIWFLQHARIPAIVALITTTIGLAVYAVDVPVEQEPDSMISHQPRLQEAYNRFRSDFGNDEDLLLSITPPRLLSPEGLNLLSTMTRRLAALDGVQRVLSLSNARQLVHGRYGAEDKPLLPEDSSAEDFSAQVEATLQDNPQYQGLLISADRQTAGLVIEPANRRNDPALRRRLIGSIRQVMVEFADRGSFHLTGVGVQKIDVASYVQRDQKVLLPMVAVVLAGMLAMIFRRLSGVLLPLLSTMVSLVWTMGIYALCGFELNTITSLLPPVVMVLAVSNSIHLYNGWLHLEGAAQDRVQLLAGKVGSLLTPCLFTALTTALGLASLSISAVPAVRQFGLFAAIGVMLSLVASLTIVPLGLSFLALPSVHQREGFGLLRRTLQFTAKLSVDRPRLIMSAAILSLLVALGGLPRLQNNTDMVGYLRDDAALAVDTRYIDKHLAGVNALEFMISRQDSKPLENIEDYEKIAAFVSAAQAQQPVASVFSILTLLRQVHRAEADDTTLSLPDNNDTLHYELDLMSMADDQSLQQRFLTPDRRTARVSVWLHDVGSRAAVLVTNDLLTSGETIFDDSYRLTPTGSFYQMTQDSNRLVVDMSKSFSLSVAMVLLAILLLLRSVRLTLLAMIPNVIPILWTVGLMGYCGIDLSTGTAMIGAVVIGLAVDDTIHYMVHYRRVYSGDVSHAITMTTTQTGRALTIASLVLAIGFWVGCFGSFKPTVYFSLLVGGTLLGALVCDLLVLPACLMLGYAIGQEKPT